MSDTKRKLAMFAFYDRDSIQSTLESMAEKGWMLEKAGNYTWLFRRTEPKKVHVSVVYVPDASVYDPCPSEKEEFLEELCARDGWKLQYSWGQMKIFYNERENPTPIETDPLTQVETIHKAMKKKGNRDAWLNLGLGLYLMLMCGWSIYRDPAQALSQGFMVWLLLDGLLLILSSAINLISWHHWYRKAYKAAQEGEFLGHRSLKAVSFFISFLTVPVLILMLTSFRGRFGFMVLCFLPVILTTLVTGWITNALKEQGASRRKNLTVTIAAAVLMSMLTLGAVVFTAIHYHMVSPSKPVGTYQMYGRTWDVYNNEMPLEIADLQEAAFVEWSREKDGRESFLVSQYNYRQWPLSEDQNIPELRYEIIDVKLPFLYDFCKNGILRRTHDHIKKGEVVWTHHYEQAEPGFWGAEEVWQLCNDNGLTHQYLLCYENRIVELVLWDSPTKQQMEIISKKLAQ